MAIALLVVTGHVLGLGHLLLVSHRRCEHGAMVHARAAASEDESRPTAQRHEHETSDSAVGVGDGGGTAEDGHEHCEPFGVMPAVVAVAPHVVAPTVLQSGLVAWAIRASSGRRAVSILFLAPKSSPPV